MMISERLSVLENNTLQDINDNALMKICIDYLECNNETNNYNKMQIFITDYVSQRQTGFLTTANKLLEDKRKNETKILLEHLWSRIIKDKSNLNRILSLLNALFELLFFNLVVSSSNENVNSLLFDLRTHETFFELIQHGLVSHHSETKEFALKLLQKTVDWSKESAHSYSTSFSSSSYSSNVVEWTRYFHWDSQSSINLSMAWEVFFSCMDILRSGNLIIELFSSKFNDLLISFDSKLLHSSWIVTILKCGLQSHDLSQKTRFLEYIFSHHANYLVENSTSLLKTIMIMEHEHFILDFLLNEVQNNDLFYATSQINHQNYFNPLIGETLSTFITECLLFIHRNDCPKRQEKWIQSIVDFLQTKGTSSIAVTYILQGLSSSSISFKTKSIKDIQINQLCQLLDGEQSKSVSSNKSLLTIYVWKLVETHLDIASASFDCLCCLIWHICPVVNEMNCRSSFFHFISWFQQQSISEDAFFDALRKYTEYVLTLETQIDINSDTSRLWTQIARTACVYTLNSESRLQRLNRILQPLFEKFYNINQKPYISHQFKMNLFLFVGCFMKEMSIWRPDLNIARSFSLFYECVDFIISFVDIHMFDKKSSISDAFIFYQILTVLCIGVKIIPPVSTLYDQIPGDNKGTLFIKPLLLNIFPSFKILDLMDTWRKRASQLLNSNDVKSGIKALLIIRVCLTSELTLTPGQPASKSPMSSTELQASLVKIIKLNEHQICESIEDCPSPLKSWMEYRVHQVKCQFVRSVFLWNAHFKIGKESLFGQVIMSNVISELKTPNERRNTMHNFELLYAVVDSSLKSDSKWINLIDLHTICNFILEFLKSSNFDSVYIYQVVSSSIDFLLHPMMLLKSVEYTEIIQQFILNIISLGNNLDKVRLIPRMSYRLAYFLNKFILPSSCQNLNLLLNDEMKKTWFNVFSLVVLELVSYVPNDGDRIQYNLQYEFIFSLKLQENESAFNFQLHRTLSELNMSPKDIMVRVHMNDFLSKLDSRQASHVSFANKLLDSLFDKYLSIHGGDENNANIKNSLHIWCSVHVLLAFVQKENAEMFFKKCRESMVHASIDGILYYYIGWAMARLLIQFPSLMSLYWLEVSNFSLPTQVISNLLTVSLLVGPFFQREDQKQWYKSLFNYLVPWSYSHYNDCRLLAQLSLMQSMDDFRDKLKQMQKQQEEAEKKEGRQNWGPGSPVDQVDELFNQKVCDQLIKFLKENNETANELKQIRQKNYFVSQDFHPIDDVCLEFIFYKGVEVVHNDSLWLDKFGIHPIIFQRLYNDCGEERRHIPLINRKS